MKKRYKAPCVTVEELTKKDVLCASGGEEATENPDNIQQSLLNFASWWD